MLELTIELALVVILFALALFGFFLACLDMWLEPVTQTTTLDLEQVRASKFFFFCFTNKFLERKKQ